MPQRGSPKDIEWVPIAGICLDYYGNLQAGTLKLLSGSTVETCQAACSSFTLNYDSYGGSGIRAC